MRKRSLVLVVVAVVAVVFAYYFFLSGFFAGYGPRPPGGTEDPRAQISLPAGFSIEVYADVPNARSMALSDSGVLFVGTRESDKVYAVVDDEVKVVASGLIMPNGVALRNGSLYVAEVNRIVRFDDIERNLNNATYTMVRDDFPTETQHGWKFIRFGPDGKLYVPIGAPVQGLHFGFPYCHGGTIHDPEFTDRTCAEFEKPALQLDPHVAALGMRFYTGEMFPEYYRNGIFIAEHGSWNRKDPIGSG